MKKYIQISLLFLLLFLSSCLSKERRPKGVLKKEQLSEIIVDIHIANALNKQRVKLKLPENNISKEIYLSVCKKHDVSEDVFENSIIYYGKNPKEYEKVYDLVLNKLNEMEEIVKSEEKE